MKLLKGIPVLFIAGLVVLLILQKRDNDRLADANRALAARLKAIEEQPVPDDSAQVEEFERLRKDQRELLKLRGELNLVKRQLQEAKVSKKPVFSETEPTIVPIDQGFPVRKFEAMAEMTLQQGESAVIGGWETSPGKRTVVLTTPTIIGPSGLVDPNGNQVTVSARFIEMPEALFNANFVPGQDGSLKQAFGAAEMKRLLQWGDAEGVTTVAAPNITTLSGRQAQVSVLDVQTVEGRQFEAGPSLDIIPTIAGNGSVQVTLIPSLNLRNNRQ